MPNKFHNLLFGSIWIALPLCLNPVAAQAESRGYVIGWLATASYYTGDVKMGCPDGRNGGVVEGRYGSLFGTTVHIALGLVLREPPVSIDEAVRRAARRTGLTDRLAEAAADVERSVASLRRDGLMVGECAVEYPLAGAWHGGLLLSGYIDLVVADSNRLNVIDFKTDAPPAGAVEETYPEYVRQVRAYGKLLADAGVPGARRLHCGLLFTGDGSIRWVGV